MTKLWMRRRWNARVLLSAVTAAVLVCGVSSVATGAGPAPQPSSPSAVRGDPMNPTFDLQTRVAAGGSGDRIAVTVGDKTYHPPEPGSWTCPTGVWVLQLERASLEKEDSDSFPLCTDADAKRLTDTLSKIPSENAVIANSLDHAPGGDSRTLAGLGKAMAEIGVPTDEFAAINLAQTAFSVYGIPGLPAGQAYTAKGTLAEEAAVTDGSPAETSINGTLAVDNKGNFALTMPDYGLYDIGADGKITLEDHVYPVTDGFTGGFHVLVVDRRTLKPISDRLYRTYDSPAGQYRMGTDLAQLAASRGQSVMIFLASVGTPVGGRQLPTGPAKFPAPCAPSAAFTVTCTYKHTEAANRGTEQRFTVPADVDSLHVTLQGGYGGFAKSGGVGGNPDRVTADLPVASDQAVKAGQILYVEVAGQGTSGGNIPGGVGGWNGGAGGGSSDYSSRYGWPGGGGGGASDLRSIPRDGVDGNSPKSLASRIAVAGGGGGAGGNSYDGGHGGSGGDAGGSGSGGLPGARSQGEAGEGGGAGTSSHGGVPGAGSRGDAGSLGKGGSGTFTEDAYGASGGGGGGYYGGGGGGIGGQAYAHHGGGGGGGGGSSLVPAGGTALPVPRHEPATVTISYPVPYGTLAQALRPFGATPTVINGLGDSPRYALAGALNTPDAAASGESADSPEASPQIRKGATGRLQGVLQRGHENMRYGSVTSNAPMIRSINGTEQAATVTNYGLYDVISHVDEEWPVPVAGADHDPQQRALTYLSKRICECEDIRDEYNLNQNTIQNRKEAMAAALYESGHGFDEANFLAVKHQLGTELADVYLVDGLKQGMSTLLSNQQHMLPAALHEAYTDVRESIKVPDNTKLVASIISFILEFFTIVAEAAQLHAVAAALGIINAVLNISTELSHKEGGGDNDALETTVGNLERDTAGGFEAALTSMSQTFDYVYGNWGKLSEVASGMNDHAKTWDVSTENAGKYVTAASDAIKLSYYRALTGVSYQRFEAQGAPTSDLGDWCMIARPACLSAGSMKFQYPSSAYTFPAHAPGLDFKPANDNILLTTNTGSIHPLTPELMRQMRETGLYPPYLFLRWPMIKGETCPANFKARGGGGNFFVCSVGQPTRGVGSSASPRITTTSLPVATVGRPYRATLTATGGMNSIHKWTLRSNNPAGITLSSSGVLSGTPTTAGKYPFKVSVDGRATASLTLTVHPAEKPAPVAAPAPAAKKTPTKSRTATATPSTAPTTVAAATAETGGGGGLAMTGLPVLSLLGLAVALLVGGIALTRVRRRGSN